MGDFKQNRGKRFDGSRGGGFSKRDRGPITMHQAICAQCGKSCEVPFRPTEGKQVFCDICFGGRKDAGNNRGGDRFAQRSRDNYNAPVRQDFGSGAGKVNGGELKEQLVILNAKIERLIKAVEVVANIKSSVVENKIKKTTKEVPVVKVKKLPKKVSKNKK